MRSAGSDRHLLTDDDIDRIAGKTELQVTAGETGFDEQVLETPPINWQL